MESTCRQRRAIIVGLVWAKEIFHPIADLRGDSTTQQHIEPELRHWCCSRRRDFGVGQ